MALPARAAAAELTLSTGKGSNFLGLLRAVERLHGAQNSQRVLAALPREVGVALRDGHVLAMGWYPVDWYAALHTAIDQVLGLGPAGARALGQYATASDFTTMHRLIASMLSVETVFGQTHRIMGLYWKGGVIERMALTGGSAALRFAGWRGFTRLIWEDVVGSCVAVLGLSGAHNVVCRASRDAGDPDMLNLDLRWD